MALVDLDYWSTEYESCRRLNKLILKQLHELENCSKSLHERNELDANIKINLKQLDNELRELELKLNDTTEKQSIAPEEIIYRQKELSSLQSEYGHLHKFYRCHNDQGTFSNSRTKWTDVSIDVEALKQHQASMIEKQNQGLEELSQTLSRQKSLAARMGQEIDDQNEVLNNLANTMERVHVGVNQETRNINSINRDNDTTWRYWLIIIALFIANVIASLL